MWGSCLRWSWLQEDPAKDNIQGQLFFSDGVWQVIWGSPSPIYPKPGISLSKARRLLVYPLFSISSEMQLKPRILNKGFSNFRFLYYL